MGTVRVRTWLAKKEAYGSFFYLSTCFFIGRVLDVMLIMQQK